MLFERENCKAIEFPSPKRIAVVLRQLGRGRSSFASITAEDGSYLQVAGFQGGCRLEWRDTIVHRHYCAFQNPPVGKHADGMKFATSAGDILMKQDEWFLMEQVIEAFVAFLDSTPFPSYIQWRDITEALAAFGVNKP